jgi:thiol-disulfide isomerase/thioredoxin
MVGGFKEHYSRASYQWPPQEAKCFKLHHCIEFVNEEVLVHFCSPSCGFCQKMMPEIKEWEANPPGGAPRLLVVSDESVEENKTMGISSPMVLDNTDQVWDAFVVTGTPSAVLVDAEGRIGSKMVMGSGAVLELIRSHRTAA